MTKRAFAGQAFAGAIAIAIGASASRDVKTRPMHAASVYTRNREGSIPKQFHNTLSKTNSRTLGEEKEKADEEEKEYANYVKQDIHEHYEELITEDDDGMTFVRIDDDDILINPPSSTSTPTSATYLPTTPPTPIGTSFWDDLDNYEDSYYKDDISSDSEDYAYYDPVTLKCSLGVVNFNIMSEKDQLEVIGMALHTNTEVINNHSDIPFLIHENGKIEHYNNMHNGQNGHRIRALRDGMTVGFGVGASVEEKEGVKNERTHLADLFLEGFSVEVTSHNWWVVTGIYNVYRSPRDNSFSFDNNGKGHRVGRPVKNRFVLNKIEGICKKSLEDSIRGGVYWKTLQNIEFGNQDMVLNGKIFYANDAGIVDCKPVGEEYALSQIYCPIERPVTGPADTCPNDIIMGDQLPPFMGDGTFDVPIYSEEDSIRDATYTHVIAESLSDVEWGVREWVGLALMVSTIVWTIVLSLTAHFVFKKRKAKILWGRALTPTGVDDILQVGWRVYEEPKTLQQQQEFSPENLQDQIQPPQLQEEQPQQEQPQQEQSQLFLQIYDKGQGIGYNDENSLLRGGVEAQMFAPPDVAASGPTSWFCYSWTKKSGRGKETTDSTIQEDVWESIFGDAIGIATVNDENATLTEDVLFLQ